MCFKLHSFLLILGFILITIVTIIDLYHIIKKINLTKLYNILVFFGLYYIAEFFSRNVVYIVVDNVPDSYSYAINILNIIHIISILIFFISLTLMVILLISTLIYILQTILNTIGIKFNFINQIIFSFILKRTHFKNELHVIYFAFFGTLSMLYFLIFLTNVYFNALSFAPNIIHISSYYQNNKICSKISPDSYIHILGDNKVSISPFNTKFAFNLITNKPNFTTQECN